MNYFRFFPDCTYITGPVRGALYIPTLGKLIHFSKIETEIVNRWLANERIDSVESKYPEIAHKLLNRLVSEGIGTCFSTAVYVEPYEPVDYKKERWAYDIPPVIKKAYIQLNNQCNAHCSFCGNSDYLMSIGCVTCLRWLQNDQKTNINKSNLDVLIKQLSDLETQSFIFSGGNPLLEWDKLVAVVKKAISYRSSMRFFVNTNAFGLNEKIAKQASEFNIAFNFTVFSDSREGYKKITGSEEIFDSLLKAVDLCKTNQLEYAISMLICQYTRDDYNKIQQFAKNLGGIFLSNSEVFPKAGTKKPMVGLPIGEELGEKYFSKIDSQNFFDAKHYSRCLNGTIAVSYHGLFLPCPMWAESVGNIPEDDIFSVFRNKKLEPIWELNKTKIPICKECEFRFACAGCVVTDKLREKDPSIHNAVCTYRPNKGEWFS